MNFETGKIMETKHSTKRRWIWIIVAVSIVITMISFVIIRIKEVEHIPTQENAPWALNTAIVQNATVTKGYPVLATLLHQGDVTLSAQIGGLITHMGPREGVSVKKGAVLAQVDTRTIQDEISGLKARLAAAKANKIRSNDEYKREKHLMDAGGSSQSSLDAYHTAAIAADNQVKTLENQIQALTVKEEYGRITSPVDGVISTRLHEPGDVIMPGQPIYQITSSGDIRIHVEFPQDLLKVIRKGTILQLVNADDTLNVALDRIYPLVNGFDLGAADADLKKKPFNLANGARLSGRIVLESDKTGVEVPAQSIITDDTGRNSYLFKVRHEQKGDILQKIHVAITLVGQNGVAVRGDIRAGDEVVVAHESVLLALKNGDPVIINHGVAL